MIVRPKKKVLPSGLTVVTVEAPHLHTCTVAVYVRVGSRHETKRENGLSHLLEHLFFRGTKRFPSSLKMHAAVEAVGGSLNAVTMRDLSTFWTPVPTAGVKTVLEVLGEMLTRPHLKGLETEKRVILEEMLDEVDERGRDIDVDNLSRQALYGEHPLGMKIAGTPRTVRALTRAQVKRHLARHYVTGNLVVSVAGPVKHAAILPVVKRAFARLPRGPRATETPPKPGRTGGPHLATVTLDESQVHVRLSFRTVQEGHPDAVPLAMLRRVLDDGLSSRLQRAVVEQSGLAYGISASVEPLHDAGTFDVDFSSAPDNAGKVVDLTLGLLGQLRAGRITTEELDRARRRFHLQLDFLLDSPDDLCGWFGGIELFRPAPSFTDEAKRVDAVTRADLKRVARTYFTAEALSVVAVGPYAARARIKKALTRASRRLS